MTFLKNACRRVSGAVKGFGCKLAVLAGAALVALSPVAAHAAADDYSELTTGVVENISSIGTILMSIGGAIIGVSVVFIIVRFIRRMVSG